MVTGRQTVAPRRRGCLFIVSGPSGAGKTSICGPALVRLSNLSLSVSVTTRSPRAGERDGVDYRFVDAQTFERMIERGELAEWAEVHGNRYGTPRATIDEALADGRDLVLDIDVQGAEQIKRVYPEAVMIFLLPPSLERLEERLRGRATDDEQSVVIRLRNACLEIRRIKSYDYVLINEDLPTAVDAFESIVRAERLRVSRLDAGDLDRLIASFAPKAWT